MSGVASSERHKRGRDQFGSDAGQKNRSTLWWGDEDIAELHRLWRLGASVAEIAASLKRSETAIGTRATREGLTKRQRPSWSDEKCAEFAALWNSNTPRQKIARHFRIALPTACRRAQELGLGHDEDDRYWGTRATRQKCQEGDRKYLQALIAAGHLSDARAA